MPNAAQYREAALRYRAFGEHYLRQAALVSGWPVSAHLGPGPVAEAVSVALRNSSSRLSAASGELARLALVCDGRAVICEGYRRQVDAYDRLHPLERVVTHRPPPPFSWVSL